MPIRHTPTFRIASSLRCKQHWRRQHGGTRNPLRNGFRRAELRLLHPASRDNELLAEECVLGE
jgi:hypothetical protein